MVKGRRRLRRERVQGKGSGKWREGNRRRQLQTTTQPGVMPTPPRNSGEPSGPAIDRQPPA